MHYKDEAHNRWKKRTTIKELEAFDKLDFENKICFTVKAHPHLKSTIQVKEYEGKEHIGDMYSKNYTENILMLSAG